MGLLDILAQVASSGMASDQHFDEVAQGVPGNVLAGGLLGRVMSPGSQQITPDQASELSPEQVQEVVTHAHQAQPGIADELAGFYAQHAGLIKTLGGAALAIAMVKMKDHVERA